MKRAFLFLLFLCSFLVGCQPQVPVPVITEGGKNPGGRTSRPRFTLTKSQRVDTSSVSLEEATAFIQNRYGDMGAFVIEPYNGSTSTIQMYIVNFHQGGWVILSADKRTPAILAESENGVFEIDEANMGLMSWMEETSQRISVIKNTPDDDLPFTRDAIQLNKKSWDVKKLPALPQRFIPGDGGHWETDTTYYNEAYETVDHMTPHWDQNSPYNDCCPLQSNSLTERAPVGCVAVAASGVLYYLHSILGYPQEMVSSGYCTGDIYNYQKYFSSPSSSVWNSMSYNYQSSSVGMLPEAVLVSYIGDLVCMNYTNDYSWALPSDIVSAYSTLGIDCSFGTYNDGIAKTNLNNGLPVIVTASNQLIPVDGRIHCFVIDGYKKTRNVTCVHHYWVPDPHPSPIPIPEEEDYYTYSYVYLGITKVKINWGWWTQWQSVPVNDGWYTLTGDWEVTCNGQTYDYNYNRTMVYGFAIAE